MSAQLAFAALEYGNISEYPVDLMGRVVYLPPEGCVSNLLQQKAPEL